MEAQMTESVNERHARRLMVKRELVEVEGESVLAAQTFDVGTIDVIGVVSCVGRLTTDQEVTINTWYGSDGSEEALPQSSVVAAGESQSFLFEKVEETLRIEIVAGGSDVTDLSFTLLGFVDP